MYVAEVDRIMTLAESGQTDVALETISDTGLAAGVRRGMGLQVTNLQNAEM